jgi:hypothetical protein
MYIQTRHGLQRLISVIQEIPPEGENDSFRKKFMLTSTTLNLITDLNQSNGLGFHFYFVTRIGNKKRKQAEQRTSWTDQLIFKSLDLNAVVAHL